MRNNVVQPVQQILNTPGDTQLEQVVSHGPRDRDIIRILVLFDRLYNLNGGAERSLLKIAQLLPRDRFQLSIATFWEPDDRQFLKEFGCKVHILPFAKCFSLAGLNIARQLRTIIRSERISIVQTFFESSDTWGTMVAKLSGCPIVISSRRDMGFNQTTKHRIAYRLLGRVFDRVHTVSEEVRQFTISQDRLCPSKVVNIPNGIYIGEVPTADRKKRLRAQYGIAENVKLVLDVGMIKPVKGFDLLAKAAKAVLEKRPDTLFMVVGGVSDRGYFEQVNKLIADLNISKSFRFMGLQDDPAPFLEMADVFCHLSLTDGLSNALLEAMSMALPCVISRVGGNPEAVVDGETGFIVPNGDYRAAAERLSAILDNPRLACAMGAHSREVIESEFTAEIMVRRFVSLYDEMIQIKSKRQ